MIQKAVFLDRDGVINVERGDYTYKLEDFVLVDGVVEAVAALHRAGYRLIVVTNQAGISKGLFTTAQMKACHAKMMHECKGMIDHIYYSPWHPTVSESLARKPSSLLFERAVARFNLDAALCWMVGDRQRDLDPAMLMGMRTIGIGSDIESTHFRCGSLIESVPLILGNEV